MVGAIILWLDNSLVSAAIWLLVGIVIGTCALRLVAPFFTPAFEWLNEFTSDPELRRREFELMLEGKTETEEFKRLCDQDGWRKLSTTSSVGACHGVFFGGIGGALIRWDFPDWITASQGALCGLLFGMVGAPFLAAVILAVMIPVDKTRTRSARIWQRVSMLATPLIVFPVVWHCLKWKLKRLRKNA